MNHQFVLRYDALRGWKAVPLAMGLDEIVSAGFEQQGDCVLLAYFVTGKTNVTPSDLHDKTGYEAFLNHVHIEDHATCEVSRNALRFAVDVLTKWREDKWAGDLNAIISIDDGTATARFHVRRPGEFWLAQDLDEYREAVLTFSSRDLAILDALS